MGPYFYEDIYIVSVNKDRRGPYYIQVGYYFRDNARSQMLPTFPEARPGCKYFLMYSFAPQMNYKMITQLVGALPRALRLHLTGRMLNWVENWFRGAED